ncbi:MAG: Gfo/Idh/MocA family oxidoreductase [Pseudarcicella sp.]|nr:Gfo/Idh/MocA family oxidoreductase [Pseudarcicella sp.]
MNKQIKIGLIGVGNMGKNHLRVLSILKDVEIAFVFDPDEQKRNQLREQYDVNFVDSFENLLSEIDGVIISAPTVFHYNYIELLAGKVKNIFIEKPMTATIEEAIKVQALQDKYGFNIMVGFIERFNPAVMELKKLISTDQVINIDITRTNKLSSRITDVDVVSDLMIHDIDLALYLNGEIKSIYAQGYVDGKMIGFANTTLVHQNGAISRLQASRVTDKKDRSIKVTCKDMYIDCDLLRKEIIINKQAQTFENSDKSYTIQSIQENVSVKLEEALLLEHQAFVRLCRNQADDSMPGFNAGLNSVKVCSEIQNQILGHAK